MRRWTKRALLALLVIAAVLGAGWAALDRDTRALLRSMPTNTDVLFWSDAQRDAGFRMLDGMPWLVQSRVIARGTSVHPLPRGEALELGIDLDRYFTEQRVAGLVVLVDGRVVLERYGLDFGPQGRWTSFSVAKSITSTLVGAAIQDGSIRSLDDKVSDYIPDLAGSVYDDVSVRQLLTMTSGVGWNEDYSDPDSDVARFNNYVPEPGVDATVGYMRQLQRVAPPGEHWAYKTGETNLLGVLVSSATRRPLAEYLSEEIWAPYGMEQDATWLLGSTGHEISGCCIQASTRDMARFGQFVLGGGRIGGEQIVPHDWFEHATRKQTDIGTPGRGYGFQWWTFDDGTFAAQGIFGQGIFIDSARQLVIATNGNWPVASAPEFWQRRTEFYRAVQSALDARQRR